MSYEHLMGLGQPAAGGSVMDIIEAQKEAGKVNQWTPPSNGGDSPLAITFMANLTGLQLNPPGTVSTMPEERYNLKMWACKYYGSSSSKCKKTDDPDFTYMEPVPLALFRNAQLSQAALARTPVNPIATAKNAIERRHAQQLLPMFFAWWRQCNKSTWAYWTAGITAGIGSSDVPREAWDWFKRAMTIKVGSGIRKQLPSCGKSPIDTLFKVRRVHKASEMAVSQPAQAGADPDKPVEQTPEQAAADPCPGATLAVTAPKVHDAHMLAQGCCLLSSIVSGSPDLNRYRCPPKFERPWETPTGVDQTGQIVEETKQEADDKRQQADQSRSEADAAQNRADQTQDPRDQQAADAANEAAEEAERAAEEAELLASEMEEQAGFLSRYKWFLAIGGFAAVGAGLWYYFFKYKPAQVAASAQAAASAPVANPDEEPVYDVRGRMIGTFWQSAVPGRWVARSSIMQRPLFSAESPERAIEWIEDVADRVR